MQGALEAAFEAGLQRGKAMNMPGNVTFEGKDTK